MANIHGSFLVERWTPATLKCYLRGCVCSEDCEVIRSNLETLNASNCKCKTAVVELVRRYGVPIIRGQDFSRGIKDVL